jgi:MoxR-like ATPase
MQRSTTLETLPTGRNAQRAVIDKARQSLGTIILGKDEQISLAVACLLARGHLLIEDLPGLGKTMLAQALSRVLGLSFSRIQFTSDLLPADIIGVSVFRQNSGEFEFQPGPVFAQLILADEVNRATPKAQSALLEAMEEHQVSVDGNTRELPTPFFVVATQNPGDQIGTFPLPESQLDRFLMRVEIGYPNEESERELLAGEDRREMLKNIAAVRCNRQRARSRLPTRSSVMFRRLCAIRANLRTLKSGCRHAALRRSSLRHAHMPLSRVIQASTPTMCRLYSQPSRAIV